jgi:hypothetical protein
MRGEHHRLDEAQAPARAREKAPAPKPMRDYVDRGQHERNDREFVKVTGPEAKRHRPLLQLARAYFAFESHHFSLDLVKWLAHDDGVTRGERYDRLVVALDRFDQVAIEHYRLSTRTR